MLSGMNRDPRSFFAGEWSNWKRTAGSFISFHASRVNDQRRLGMTECSENPTEFSSDLTEERSVSLWSAVATSCGSQFEHILACFEMFGASSQDIRTSLQSCPHLDVYFDRPKNQIPMEVEHVSIQGQRIKQTTLPWHMNTSLHHRSNMGPSGGRERRFQAPVLPSSCVADRIFAHLLHQQPDDKILEEL
jgi:hypothetical protein